MKTIDKFKSNLNETEQVDLSEEEKKEEWLEARHEFERMLSFLETGNDNIVVNS